MVSAPLNVERGEVEAGVGSLLVLEKMVRHLKRGQIFVRHNIIDLVGIDKLRYCKSFAL